MKIHYFLILLLIIAAGCKKNKVEPAVTPTPSVTPVPGKQASSTKALRLDSIRNSIPKSICRIISDSTWTDSSGVTLTIELNQENNVFYTAENNDFIYPGALLKGNTFENAKYRPVTGYQQQPIEVFTDALFFDPFVSTHVPSAAATNDFITRGYHSGSETVSPFSYNSGRFRNYDEIGLAHLYNLKLSDFLPGKAGAKRFITKKNAYYISYKLEFFTLGLNNIYDQILAAGIDPASIPNEPVVVWNTTYGRLAILAIESDADESTVNAAYKAILNNNASAAQIQLFRDAELSAFMMGYSSNEVNNIKQAKGAEFIDLFSKTIIKGSTYTPADYGAPISFNVAGLKDRTGIYKKFRYKLDYKL